MGVAYEFAKREYERIQYWIFPFYKLKQNMSQKYFR